VQRERKRENVTLSERRGTCARRKKQEGEKKSERREIKMLYTGGTRKIDRWIDR